jgi:hypothetical protein
MIFSKLKTIVIYQKIFKDKIGPPVALAEYFLDKRLFDDEWI